MKKYIFSVLLLVSLTATAAVKKVLFIGNSYTYVNDLPNLFRQLSNAMGDSVIVDSYAPGGYTLQQHSTDATALSKIAQNGWDFVVIQEQSQKPSFPPQQVETGVYPYAKTLDSLVHISNPCAETVFYMTWGRKNGDAGNCGFYAPLCTYAGMQARLRESYLQMTIDNNATVAPVGMAWKRIIDTQPAINLYNADESHPVETGSYLAACVFYSSLFHKPSYNCPYTFTLADSIANKLQLAADFTVFDSLAQWQENGKLITPKFNYTVNNALVTFNQLSTGSDSYNWDFGNGSTASGSNVQHTYTQPGEYVVTLTAYNNCRSATITDTVVVEVNQPNSLSGLFNKDIQVYPTNFDKGFLVECHESNLSIEVYTINGKLLLHKNLLQETTLVPLNDIAAQPLLYRITKNMHAVKTGRLQKL